MDIYFRIQYSFAKLGNEKYIRKMKKVQKRTRIPVYIAADVPPDVEKREFYLCVSFANHLAWVLGSAIGAFGGKLVAFDTRGLDFILTAMFFSIFLDQWEEAGDHTPAVIGLGATLFALLVFGKTAFILPALALILIGLLIYERKCV